jgi:hypothetical protein
MRSDEVLEGRDHTLNSLADSDRLPRKTLWIHHHNENLAWRDRDAFEGCNSEASGNI